MKEMLLAARLSKLAYTTDPTYPDIEIIPFDRDNIQGFFGIQEDMLYIVFTGTNELSDWLNNLNTDYQEYIVGKVHKGFFDALDRVCYDVNKIVNNCKWHRIIVTGHSLGGALATLCAVRLTALQHNVVCYTFASPRVGNRKFAKHANKILRYHRVTCAGDLVHHLPSIVWYNHCGSEYWFDHKGIHTTPTIWQRIKEAIYAIIYDWSNLDSVIMHRHSMDNYLKCVESDNA